MVMIYVDNKENQTIKKIMTVGKEIAFKMLKNIGEYFIDYSPKKHKILLVDNNTGEIIYKTQTENLKGNNN